MIGSGLHCRTVNEDLTPSGLSRGDLLHKKAFLIIYKTSNVCRDIAEKQTKLPHHHRARAGLWDSQRGRHSKKATKRCLTTKYAVHKEKTFHMCRVTEEKQN